jgi:hypothetical protein
MQLALIINSIVCVAGVVLGLMFAGGSIISIANMKVPWAGALLIAAVLVPMMFMVSGIGAWVANARGSSTVAISFMAVPWLYVGVFVLGMLASFKS